jgi:hypothetical protein
MKIKKPSKNKPFSSGRFLQRILTKLYNTVHYCSMTKGAAEKGKSIYSITHCTSERLNSI